VPSTARTLAIRAEPDLRGASVTGTRVQAYAVPAKDATFRVELWYVAAPRRDAFKTVPADDLAEAALIAVDYALNRRHAVSR